MDNSEGLPVPEEVKTAYYYDSYRRVVEERSFTENGGKDLKRNEYNFAGQLVSQNRWVNLTDSDHTTAERNAYEYDHRGRLTKLWHGIDDMANRLIATYTYDELGRQKEKLLGNSIETVRSTYDIRGRLTTLGGSNFYQQQAYEKKLPGERSWGTKERYFGGDIRATLWKHKGKHVESVLYRYDSYGRLTNSGDMSWRYDANGNMVEKPGDMGSGNAWYYGNQVVTDESGSIRYYYDSNGNMTGSVDQYSLNRPTIDNILYNRLSLPEQLSKSGDWLRYGYLADGQKREKSMNGVTTRTYRASMVYGGDGTPDHVVHPEGIAIHTGSRQWQWYYHLHDYLGNVRAVVREDGELVQQTDYDPFGKVKNFLQNTNLNRYLYGGKELQDEQLGGYYAWPLNLYDFEARFYSYSLSRFMQPDPLAEKYYSISPYAYCLNNPIIFVDKDGKDVLIWYKNDKGAMNSYRYAGGSVSHANIYVNKVVNAINYNINNGGGDPSRAAISNKDIGIGA